MIQGTSGGGIFLNGKPAGMITTPGTQDANRIEGLRRAVESWDLAFLLDEEKQDLKNASN
jgi:hypothetical protein